MCVLVKEDVSCISYICWPPGGSRTKSTQHLHIFNLMHLHRFRHPVSILSYLCDMTPPPPLPLLLTSLKMLTDAKKYEFAATKKFVVAA